MSSAESHDTIVALATPPGRGGVGILRLSGPDANSIACAIAGSLPFPRIVAHRVFSDESGPIDSGLVARFEKPRSYTGEDVVELHGHGGPVVMDLLLRQALKLGARQAAPGEFTQRAYLNERLDLAEAEAVADLIDAGSEAAARAAQRSLSGEFSRRVTDILLGLEYLRIEVEASIDFVDEDIALQEEAGVRQRLQSLRAAVDDLLRVAGRGRLLTEGCIVVIAGRPNAGKSSLMNALAGHDAAIVTDIPGTTRDVLRERVNLEGLPITLLDTAGIRHSDDVVEAEGIRRAKSSIQSADHVLYLVDLSDPQAIADSSQEIVSLGRETQTTLVYTKSDKVQDAPADGLTISVTDDVSLQRLRSHLLNVLGFSHAVETDLSARRRHLDALQRTLTALDVAVEQAELGYTDLFAEELRGAHHVLGEITGHMSSDDLLGRIFSTFCIGK